MTERQWSRTKSQMGAAKRWGMGAHRRRQYRRRDALFTRHDTLALTLYSVKARA